MNFANFFSKIQDQKWYNKFLNPILDEVEVKDVVLDIGTGAGKLLQMLESEKEVIGIGTDTSDAMLAEAKLKLKGTNITLTKVEAGDVLPYEKGKFDVVTICNVLFNLDDDSNDFLLKESLRVLKKGGKIIVLTPTGGSNFINLMKTYFKPKNWGILVWYLATRSKAQSWMSRKSLSRFSIQHALKYKHNIIMEGFAQLEIITK